MKILKELDRDTFKSRFGTKKYVINFWRNRNGHQDIIVSNVRTIINLEVASHAVGGVANADMMNLVLQTPYFIS